MLIAYLVIKRKTPLGHDFFVRLGKQRPFFTQAQDGARRFEKQIGYRYIEFLQRQGYGGLQAEFVLEDDCPPPQVSSGTSTRSIKEQH